MEINLINVNNNGATWLPLGILYLGAALRKEGFLVRLVDYQLKAESFWDPAVLSQVIKEAESEIVGISCMDDSLPLVLLACQEVKQKCPGKCIILGGPGPSAHYKELLYEFACLDYIIVGSGERPLLELLKCLEVGKNIAEIQGLCYRSSGRICHNIRSYDSQLLVPLSIQDYQMINLNDYKCVPVVYSRGCSFDCEFCEVSHFHGRTVKYRSTKDIVSELTLLHDILGIDAISLVDDNFGFNRKKTELFLKWLRGIKEVVWSCSTRIDLAPPMILQKYASAGCAGIFFGLESGSEKTALYTRKSLNIPEVTKRVLYAREIIGDVTVSFIWGFPFEDVSEFLKTVSLMAYFSSKGVKCRNSRLAPLRRSPIFKKYQHMLNPPRREDMDWSLLGRIDESFLPRYLDIIQQFPSIFCAYWVLESPILDFAYEFFSNYSGFEPK